MLKASSVSFEITHVALPFSVFEGVDAELELWGSAIAELDETCIELEDIMSAVNAVRGATFIIIEPLLVATAIYFCLCFPTSKIIGYFEKRMGAGNANAVRPSKRALLRAKNLAAPAQSGKGR